jgi:hypothetical protein
MYEGNDTDSGKSTIDKVEISEGMGFISSGLSLDTVFAAKITADVHFQSDSCWQGFCEVLSQNLHFISRQKTHESPPHDFLSPIGGLFLNQKSYPAP